MGNSVGACGTWSSLCRERPPLTPRIQLRLQLFPLFLSRPLSNGVQTPDSRTRIWNVSFEWTPSLPSSHLIGAIWWLRLATQVSSQKDELRYVRKHYQVCTVLFPLRMSFVRCQVIPEYKCKVQSLDSICTWIGSRWKGGSRLYLFQKENRTASCAYLFKFVFGFCKV